MIAHREENKMTSTSSSSISSSSSSKEQHNDVVAESSVFGKAPKSNDHLLPSVGDENDGTDNESLSLYFDYMKLKIGVAVLNPPPEKAKFDGGCAVQ